MRIQTRLFFGTALIVLTLTATQWWLHRRQLSAIERELGVVATAVGRGILDGEVEVLVHRLPSDERQTHTIVWFDDGKLSAGQEGSGPDIRSEVEVVTGPQGVQREVRRLERVLRYDGVPPPADVDAATPSAGEEDSVSSGSGRFERDTRVRAEDRAAERVELRVTTTDDADGRYLLLTDGGGFERRIPIPLSPTQRILRRTANRGLAVGAGLLFVGLAVSALLASRVTRPLRTLAAGAEALGQGELGVQVPENAAGEIGELERAFNRMSSRLATLEGERELWQEREHLAQLGDLSRGLAHTLRNPLNTLGLAIEELADDRADQADLVVTARAQIRRIDRWLRSFLALAAGEAAEVTDTDLRSLAADVALEAIQDGAAVHVHIGEDELIGKVVPTALRAALANLVQNAVDASPEGRPVEIEARRVGGEAVIRVTDHGPGLPDEVRARLYAPHVTTKSGGSGMGLFLARQLIVGMHGGALEMTDGAAGGTVAEIRLRILESDVEG